jgi:hypothetical protein
MQICTVLTLALVVGSRALPRAMGSLALPRATGSLDSTPEAC